MAERLFASLDERDSPTGLRDRAMLLLAARLGLRASEVVRLGLEDIDWRAGIVQIRTRKTGHGARLPLPREVGEAIAVYLERGRPASEDRHVFLLHHACKIRCTKQESLPKAPTTERLLATRMHDLQGIRAGEVRCARYSGR